MKEKLQETINKFLINSNYDSRMTLTENQTKFLFEAGIGAQSLKDVKSALGKLGEVKTIFKLGMTTERMSKLLAMDAENFLKEMKKATTKDLKKGVKVGVLGPEMKELSKMNSIREITEQAKIKKVPLTIAEMEAIKNSSRLEFTQLSREVSESTIKAAEKRAAKLAKDAGKTVADDVKNLGGTTSFRAKFANITTWQGFKDALKKWGLTAVLSTAALYALWGYFFPDKPNPESVTPTAGTTPETGTTPKTGTTPVVGTKPVKRTYTNCSGTYTLWCKSPVIYKVQGCLGITQDGKFGEDTDAALKAKGFDIGFTDNDVNKLCKPNVAVVEPEGEKLPEVGTDAESLDNISNNTETLN